MLYTPFRSKDMDEYETNTISIYEEKRSWIQSVKCRVMKHLESVEEARWMEEESKKEFEIDIGIHIDAEFEQAQMDCHMEGQRERERVKLKIIVILSKISQYLH